MRVRKGEQMQYYTTGELAKKVCVSRKTIWSWTTYGLPIRGQVIRLESERWGKHYRISEEQWQRFHALINGKPVPAVDTDLMKRDAAARERCRAMGC